VIAAAATLDRWPHRTSPYRTSSERSRKLLSSLRLGSRQVNSADFRAPDKK
jgi:hypothetical protein